MGVRLWKEAVMATAVSAIMLAALLGQAPTLWTPPTSPTPPAEGSPAASFDGGATTSAGGLPAPSPQAAPAYGYYVRNADRFYGPGSYDNRFGFGPRFGFGDRYGNTDAFVSPYGFGTRYGYLNRYGNNPYVNENRAYPNVGFGKAGGGTIPVGDLTPLSSWGELAPWLWGIPGPSAQQAAPPLEQMVPMMLSVKPEALTPRQPGVLPKPARAPATQGAAGPVNVPATQDAPQAEP